MKTIKFTKKEALGICKWTGWHWILRGQLEMFLGLKEKCVPPTSTKESLK